MFEDKCCCRCGDRGIWEDYLFKFEDRIYCFDCLEKVLEEEKYMKVYETKRYYTDDYQELGTDDDTYSLYEQICEEYEVEKIEVE